MAPFAISGIFECRVAVLKIRIFVLKMPPDRRWKCRRSLSDFEDGLRLEGILRLSAQNETA
jgi:hypothetical protein